VAENGLEKRLPKSLELHKITKKAHAGRGQETKWECQLIYARYNCGTSSPIRETHTRIALVLLHRADVASAACDIRPKFLGVLLSLYCRSRLGLFSGSHFRWT